MTGPDFSPLFPSYLWIDVEASSLSADSFPIEIGWCDASLKSDNFLIRPLDKWTDWSLMSESMHGISLETLQAQGIDALVAARRLNEQCHGRQVLSDNPLMDSAWIDQLFHDVGQKREFAINDGRQLEQMLAVMSKLTPNWMQSITEQIKSVYPHPHRAGPDSRREAARFLALAMPEEIDAILAMA